MQEPFGADTGLLQPQEALAALGDGGGDRLQDQGQVQKLPDPQQRSRPPPDVPLPPRAACQNWGEPVSTSPHGVAVGLEA